MQRYIIVLVTICIYTEFPAAARPVSYPGGWTLIEETDRQTTALWVHYTLTPNWSVGTRTEWDRQQDFLFQGIQATYLAKRWFGENYQANLYGIGGLGGAIPIDSNMADNTNVAGFIGALADWETRRLFASYRIRYLEAGDVGNNFVQAARLGFALPALLITLGAGAVMAGLASNVPGYVWLTAHKTELFVVAGVLLAGACWARWISRNAPCPADPAQARLCTRMRRIGGIILSIAVVTYLTGGFFAFFAADLLL